MATVYRAYDPLFEREVALKVLPSQLLHDPTFQARFAREAKTIATLEHTGIVPVYDFGEQDGQPFYVMRLMTGGSLAERLAYGPMSVEETVRVVSQVADALDEAHAHGVVHRDLKPGNIMFDQRGNAFLSDFGIAKVVHASTPLTSSSMLIGTPAYMSPEQGRGERDIDGRSDVYALGALLFQMLSGRVPYESETPTGQIIKHITDPIPNVLSLRKELPAGIQTVIERAMAKKKEARYATASEMAAALRRAAEGGQVTPAPQVKPTEERTVIVTEEEMPERGTGSYPTKKRKLSGWIWVGGALGLLTLLGIICLGSILLPGILANPNGTAQPTDLLYAAAGASTEAAAAAPLPTSMLAPAGDVTPTDIDTFLATPTAMPVEPPQATIKLDNTPMRSGPGTTYFVIDRFPSGMKLEVVGRSEDSIWITIKVPITGKIGWVLLDAVSLNTEVSTLPVYQAGPTPWPTQDTP
jgi:hypothetical protein